VGARLALALRTAYGVPVALKWPNDILVQEDGLAVRKLSGILTDEVASPTLGHAVVVGMGVNVRLDRAAMPAHLAGRWAALDEFVTPAPRLDEVERRAVASALEASDWLSSASGVRRARALCRQLLYGVGRAVTVDGHTAGTISELGDEGELVLTTPTDRVAIWAGDVRVEEAP
jgi:BirA family biotin operon repressor/biotin-[acetyl-CoA-carboxylase] ligase